MSLNPMTQSPIVLKSDLQPFQWLVRLVTRTGLLYMAYEKNLDSEVMKDIEDTLNATNIQAVHVFLDETRGKSQQGSLAKISYYLCKRKPCPPLMAEDYEVIIRLFLHRSFRDEFFDKAKTSGLLNREFPNKYKPLEISKWEEFAKYSTNKDLFEEVAAVLSKVWGTPTYS